MQARSLLSAGVRPSVCQVRVLYMQTDEDIVKLLSRPGSTFFLVFFLNASADTQFQEELL